MSDLYSTVYERDEVNGDFGYWYRTFAGGVLVFEGWACGHRRNAEREVREGINAREALRDCLKTAWRPSDDAPNNSFNGDQS
jgi:hypothetical protein